MLKQKIIVILGPTASGKSGLAVKLAKKFNGEVISADSRQVYKGLDIGTGKVAGRWMKIKKSKLFLYAGIYHYCIDIINPKEVYTAVDFQKDAKRAIQKIIDSEKLPIICGGTGLYIDAMLYDYKLPGIKADTTLRKKLERLTTDALFRKLKKNDARRANNIDRYNKRRLVRALEIAITSGELIPPAPAKITKYSVLKIGIAKSETALKRAIEKRVDLWIKSGLIAETKRLMHKMGSVRIRELGFNYYLPYQYIKKEMGGEQLTRELQKENWRYVKRQMTWFKRDKKTKWVKSEREAFGLVRKFLNRAEPIKS